MKKRIISLILASFMTASLFSMSLFFPDMDMLSYEEREEIITRRILKCKDVVDVNVKEHGTGISKATITITLTNDRVLVLESFGIRLKLDKLYIIKIGEFVPITFIYSVQPDENLNSRLISLGFAWFKASNIKYLDSKLKSIKNIESLIKNYDLIYSSLPESDETLPSFAYWEPIDGNEIYCEEWEKLENPYFYKTKTEGGKFYKMTEEAFSIYSKKDPFTGNTIE